MIAILIIAFSVMIVMLCVKGRNVLPYTAALNPEAKRTQRKNLYVNGSGDVSSANGLCPGKTVIIIITCVVNGSARHVKTTQPMTHIDVTCNLKKCVNLAISIYSMILRLHKSQALTKSTTV